MAATSPIHPDAALGLALALVASSDAPLLLINGDLAVIAASASFCQAFEIDAATVATKPVTELGAGEWDSPRLLSLLSATLSGAAGISAYEMDLNRVRRDSRKLVMKAHKLEYGDPANVRMVLAVADVTDARAAERLKDDLIREKAILLQEVQHRVANSLQIIASVLLQSARKVQSEETRLHLHDAHHRVMSIAAVQQQLVAAALGEVELKPYFKQLCQSLGASMIPDHERLSVDVRCDDVTVSANDSISLGLVVTELVINALKHAFPDQRTGEIKVDYASTGPDWELMVSDDGVGMPTGAQLAKPGLGTSIVEALARQLQARVNVADTSPGTAVSLVHDESKNGPAEESLTDVLAV